MKITVTSANSGDLSFPFGKTVPAHGEITIDAAELETCRDNPVVRYWFENRMLSAAPVDDINDEPVDDQDDATPPDGELPVPKRETSHMPTAPEAPAAPPEPVFITDPAPEPVVVETAPALVDAPEPVVEPVPEVVVTPEPDVEPVVEPVRHHNRRRG